MKPRGIAKKRFKRLLKKLLFPWKSSQPENGPSKQYEWSIGIYVGESPFDFASPENIDNPVLSRKDVSDLPAAFVADPFMLKVNHTWYMFFEVMNRLSGKGEIGLATSEEGIKWSYKQMVLSEPFHLSYPYVFQWMNDYYMIPETYQAGSIRLYKAAKFPTRWSFVGTLLTGEVFLDSSIFRHDGKWWLFTETNPNHKYDTLRLYYADDLIGPWLEHPKSPILESNPHIARPAGRVVGSNGQVIRYAQDCYPDYGTQVRAFEIAELTTTSYREREVGNNPVLAASDRGWNESGMHHIDPHILDEGQWIACVDGWARV